MAKGAVQHGFKVHVIAPGAHQLGDSLQGIEEDGVTVHRTFDSLGVFYFGDPRTLNAVGDYVCQLNATHRFDVVHSMFLNPPGLVGALVAKEIGRPFITSIHGSDIELMRYVSHQFGALHWVLQQADLVTAGSSELLRRAMQITPLQKSRVILNAIDTSMFETRSLAVLAEDVNTDATVRDTIHQFLKVSAQRGLVIGTAGAVRHVKGVTCLLTAFKAFHRLRPDAHLLLVGPWTIDQEEKRRIQQQIELLDMQAHVTVTGAMPHAHILAWMREISIFVLPSLHEGSSNVILEAMACGLPIIASDTGGIPELIRHEQEGLLVSPGSEIALAQQFKRLAEDPALCTRLGQTAHRTLTQRFTAEQEIQQWLDCYASVYSGG